MIVSRAGPGRRTREIANAQIRYILSQEIKDNKNEFFLADRQLIEGRVFGMFQYVDCVTPRFEVIHVQFYYTLFF